MVKSPLLLMVMVVLVNHVKGFKFYQEQIPNGDRVPHPCKPNYLWDGVGHKNIGGGGVRNPFGRDFELNEFKWDSCLCGHDSDGDGKTNGEELGDPNCVWKEGDIPEILTDLSHPGVCEPVDSITCKEKNDWSFCEYDEFQCDAINASDVIEVVLKFPKTQVPAQETTYMCMHFDLPSDQDYHVIAAKALIDNKNVMHHMILGGCIIEDGDDQSWRFNEPHECGMATTKCAESLPGWTLGSEGECTPDLYGYRVGMNGVKAVVLQVHWNNPQRSSDYYDESGMALYLTPKLRTYDAGGLSIGTSYLDIPPGVVSLDQQGLCTSECTQHLPGAIYFSDVLFHMHYLGVEGAVEHIRHGEIIRVIRDEDYGYDNPKLYTFDPPIEFLPGDELKTTCTFKSSTRSTPTYFGLGTNDEMCFVFITYYPAQPGFSFCMSYKSVDVCPYTQNNSSACNYEVDLTEEIMIYIFWQVNMACNSTDEICPSGCAETIAAVRADNPCFEGDQGEYTELAVIVAVAGDFGKQFVTLMHSCEPDWEPKFPQNTDVKYSIADEKPKPKITPGAPNNDKVCVFGSSNESTKTSVVSTLAWLSMLIVTII